MVNIKTTELKSINQSRVIVNILLSLIECVKRRIMVVLIKKEKKNKRNTSKANRDG